MKTLKALVVGAACGVASVLLGIGAAQAQCSQDDWEYRRYLAELSCDEAVQGWLEDDQLTLDEINGAHGYDGMWEACMRLATPVGPLPAAQHYDTEDGAFWQVGR